MTSSDAKAAKRGESSGTDEPLLLTMNCRRKRGRPQESSTFARVKAKASRYSGKRTVATIACNHNRSMCAAASLTATDLSFIYRQLYCTSDKVKQDAFLLSHIDVMPCKRRKRQVDVDERRRQRDLSIKYTVIKEDKTRVVICQASFLSIFCVSKDRVCRVAKYWLETGKARPENRGGHRGNIELSEKKEMARLHIQSLALRASHYGRRGKKFLPSDLSVTKMHQMFLEQNPQYPVSYSLYWSLFVYDFNLAFGHPAKDVCSPCVKFRMALKDRDLTAEEKRNTILKYMLHKRRARQFYDALNEVADAFTICFDIMENLVLPKSATGQTSNSQQLNLYVFGVLHHYGRGKAQSRHDVSLYTWLEYENAKDSNVIASALHHYLTKVAGVDLRQCPNLRLFSDSCYGNMNILSVLFALHSQMFPQLNIIHSYPIQGHSFLPIHRVFGRIEQDIRKHATILLPDEYSNILRMHGIVHQYGKDWRCCDFKKEAATFTTAPRSFEISDARVVQISGDKLGLKPAFVGEFSQHSVLKQGKKWFRFKAAPLPDVNCVKGAKKADVLKLLGEFGVSAAVQEFYERVMSDAGDEDIEQDLVDDDEDDE